MDVDLVQWNCSWAIGGYEEAGRWPEVGIQIDDNGIAGTFEDLANSDKVLLDLVHEASTQC